MFFARFRNGQFDDVVQTDSNVSNLKSDSESDSESGMLMPVPRHDSNIQVEHRACRWQAGHS